MRIHCPHDVLELHFTTIASEQVAFYFPDESTDRLPKRIWVAFCGNGSLALDWMWLLRQGRQSGRAFLLVDYPGYGKSEGYATIATTRATADNALDALAAHLGVNEREIGRPLSHLLVENYDNRAALDQLARCSRPPRIDIFHGTEDDTIPIRMGRQLAEDFPALVKFHSVAGGDHVSVIDKASREIVSTMND